MKKIIMVLGIILSITLMTIIFTYSAQDKQTVTEKKAPIVDVITSHDTTFEEKTEAEKQDAINIYDYYVSKTVHVLEYGALCLFLCMALILIKKRWLLYLLAVVISTSYAILDEIHQKFVADRTARQLDVFFDLGGALICILGLELIYTIYHFFMIKRKYQASLV